MCDDEELHDAGEDDPSELAELRAALRRKQEELEAERRRSQKWEREAVLRTSTVAGSLTTRVLAAQRLAIVVERNLSKLSDSGSPAAEEVRNALEFFREVADDPAAC